MDRELLVVPDERLRQKSQPVDKIDEHVKEFGEFLQSECRRIGAFGLAAIQYGEPLRMFAIKVHGIEAVFVNPEIVKKSPKGHVVMEACCSIPSKVFATVRPKLVKIRGLDLNGRMHTLKGHDVLAQALCHEMDHLDGVLIDKSGRYVGERKIEVKRSQDEGNESGGKRPVSNADGS